jgi:hypothetical protein
VYYLVSQVPSGSFTSIKNITDILDSRGSWIGRALCKTPPLSIPIVKTNLQPAKAPPGVPTHRALQLAQDYWLTNRPDVDVASLEAEGIHAEKSGKEYRIKGNPWTGFTNLPTRKGRNWSIPGSWTFPPVVAPTPVPVSTAVSGPGPAAVADSDTPLFRPVPWLDSHDSETDESDPGENEDLFGADVPARHNQEASEEEVEIKHEESEDEDWKFYEASTPAGPGFLGACLAAHVPGNEKEQEDLFRDDLSGDDSSGDGSSGDGSSGDGSSGDDLSDADVLTKHKRNEEASEEEVTIKREEDSTSKRDQISTSAAKRKCGMKAKEEPATKKRKKI